MFWYMLYKLPTFAACCLDYAVLFTYYPHSLNGNERF